MISIRTNQFSDKHLVRLRGVIEQALKDGFTYAQVETTLRGLMTRLHKETALLSQFQEILERDSDVAEAVVADGWGHLNDTHPDHGVDLPFSRPRGMKPPANHIYQDVFAAGRRAFRQKIQYFDHPKNAGQPQPFYWLLGWFYEYWGGDGDKTNSPDNRTISADLVGYYAERLEVVLEEHDDPRSLVARFHEVLCDMLAQMGINVLQEQPRTRKEPAT